MRHVDDLVMMMYVDDELSAEERQEVAAHLSSCADCQQMYAYWLADHSWFCRSFEDPEPFPALQLNEWTETQIDMIAAIHKRRAARRREGFWAALAAAVLAGALFALTAANQWFGPMDSLWEASRLWPVAFWIKEHIGDLLLYPIRNTLGVSALFIVLLGGLIVLNARSGSNRWDRTEGGLDK